MNIDLDEDQTIVNGHQRNVEQSCTNNTMDDQEENPKVRNKETVQKATPIEPRRNPNRERLPPNKIVLNTLIGTNDDDVPRVNDALKKN